ncbi:MAG TPA: hypothetical protein VFR85_07135 [Anaeromyxobacteraceae bacterium]|nr:hypothetical protein [Anaeromyxobacteraceae bacterium]
MGLAVMARVEPGAGRAGALEARREARGFGEHLEAARKAAGREAGAASARRAALAVEAGAEVGTSPGVALSRRRAQADGLDEGLMLRRRRLDFAERAGDERRAEAPSAAGAAVPGGGAREATAPVPRAADLAAAVEKLAAAVERRDRAAGPELCLDVGGQLSVRLAGGQKGIEVVFAGEARMARLARAELPEVLARLRERGIAVSRAEVRVGAAAGGPGALTAGEPSATSALRHGTVAKW